MNAQLKTLRQQAKIRRFVDQVPDASQRQDFLDMLDDPAIAGSAKMLNDLELVVVTTIQANSTPNEQTIFDTKKAALAYLREAVFPKISANFRLFKTPKLRQDEYIVINRDWLHGNDAFQTYAADRDVNDRLLSAGLPASVLYMPFPGAKTPTKFGVLAAWRREPETQDGRLNTLEYIPGAPDIVDHAFNTYKDVSVEAMPGIDVSIFLSHVRENLCNGNGTYYEYLIKWLAHLVQRPAERPLTGISIIGGQGTGKGIFIDCIARMLGGRRNANTTTSAKDTKSFNTAVGSKLLVVFDEATFSGDREQSDFMKKLVTEPFVRIEPKGIDAYEVANYARCFITSNNMESSTPADIGARRWLIIECRNNLDQRELAALATAIGNNGDDKPGAIKHFANGVKHHLQQVDLTDFNPQLLPDQDTGMQTKIHNHYKQDPVYAFLVEWLRSPGLTLHRSVVEKWDDEYVEQEKPLIWDDELLFADVYAVFSEMSKEAHARVIGKNRIGIELERFGIELVSKGRNVRYMKLPDPMAMLVVLRAASRFDKLVSPEQELVIKRWRDEQSVVAVEVAERVRFANRAELPTRVTM